MKNQANCTTAETEKIKTVHMVYMGWEKKQKAERSLVQFVLLHVFLLLENVMRLNSKQASPS